MHAAMHAATMQRHAVFVWGEWVGWGRWDASVCVVRGDRNAWV